MTDPTSGAGSKEKLQEEELLARLRGPYLESAGAKTEELAVLLCRCVGLDSPLSPDAVGQAEESPLTLSHRLAHSMAGSGASYGFKEISDRARSIERGLRFFMNGETEGVTVLLDLLEEALELRSVVRREKLGE